jgi:hypothetical protein
MFSENSTNNGAIHIALQYKHIPFYVGYIMSFGTNTFCHKGHFSVINDKLSEHEFETCNLNKNFDGQIYVMKNIMCQTSVAGIQVGGDNARHKN